MKIKNKISIKFISIIPALFSIAFSTQVHAYSEMQLNASGVFFPQENLNNDEFNLFGGWSARGEIMTNTGFSFGLGHTWSEGYRFIDARELYWFSEHMFGFYTGLSEHIQYYNKSGFGGGVTLGYAMPLTYYVNLNVEAEAGYGSQRFYRSIYDPFYFIASAGISVNVY